MEIVLRNEEPELLFDAKNNLWYLKFDDFCLSEISLRNAIEEIEEKKKEYVTGLSAFVSNPISVVFCNTIKSLTFFTGRGNSSGLYPLR